MGHIDSVLNQLLKRALVEPFQAVGRVSEVQIAVSGEAEVIGGIELPPIKVRDKRFKGSRCPRAGGQASNLAIAMLTED